MDCSLPGSSVLGIYQLKILEWFVISFSRGTSQPRDRTRVSRIVGRRFTVWAITNHHKFSSLKQQLFIILQFCKSEVHAGLNWVFSGSHQTEVKVSPEASISSRSLVPLPYLHGCWQNSFPCRCRTQRPSRPTEDHFWLSLSPTSRLPYKSSHY